MDFWAHRPWPLPPRPWIMAQRWRDLLFAHWPVDPERLRPRIPEGLMLDCRDGAAWVSITPFLLEGLRARGLPALPWISSFPELNFRTYVTRHRKPGVFFFSLDAASTLTVAGARTFYHLPYFNATMSIRLDADGWCHYRSERRDDRSRGAVFEARYRPTAATYHSQPGTVESFLTERYCLYAVGRRGSVYRAEIHHAPWPLQPAEVVIATNTIPDAFDLQVPATPRVLSYTRAIDVLVWLPQRVN